MPCFGLHLKHLARSHLILKVLQFLDKFRYIRDAKTVLGEGTHKSMHKVIFGSIAAELVAFCSDVSEVFHHRLSKRSCINKRSSTSVSTVILTDSCFVGCISSLALPLMPDLHSKCGTRRIQYRRHKVVSLVCQVNSL